MKKKWEVRKCARRRLQQCKKNFVNKNAGKFEGMFFRASNQQHLIDRRDGYDLFTNVTYYITAITASSYKAGGNSCCKRKVFSEPRSFVSKLYLFSSLKIYYTNFFKCIDIYILLKKLYSYVKVMFTIFYFY